MEPSKHRRSRIAFFSTMSGFPWGGSEELWSKAAHWLAGAGVEVSASVKGWPELRPQVEALRAAGVRVWERRWNPPALPLRILQRLHLLPQPGPQAEVAKWLDEVRPELVCISDGAVVSDIGCAALCQDRGIPFVQLSQANAELFWPSEALAAECRRVLIHARRFFFVSEANRRLFEDQVGMRFENAEVVRNPFKVSYQASVLPRPWDEGGEIRLACVARLEPVAKGQDILIRVLSREKWRRRPLGIRFYGEGPYREGLERMARMHGVKDRVEFVGQVSDIEGVWRENDGLILASRLEGLPLALVEAALCGRMGIGTAVGGIGELIVEGETGFLAEAATDDLLDAAMERAWARRAEWGKMGMRARERAVGMYPECPEAVFGGRLLELAKEIRSGS